MPQNSIAVIAALPPPVNGNFVVTKIAVESLRQQGSVLVYNLSVARKMSHQKWRIVKGIRSLLSLLKLMQWRLLRQRPASLYTVANSAGGLYQNILTIGLARVLGYRCVLHHHSYSYLNEPDWRMKVIHRLLGTAGTHVVLAPEMEARFRELYGDAVAFHVLPNTFIADQCSTSLDGVSSIAGRPFRLGHLSNLTIAKGLKHVIDTFEALNRTRDVHLTLAGPLMGGQETSLVDELLQRHPERVTYMGPVYDEQKTRFFENIDVLLFPTEYRVEAQPLVIFETFAYGKPVIAYGRACIPSMIGTHGGHVVPVDEAFVPQAQRTVESWIDEPTVYDELSAAVRHKADRLRVESAGQLDAFARYVRLPKEQRVCTSHEPPSGSSNQPAGHPAKD